MTTSAPPSSELARAPADAPAVVRGLRAAWRHRELIFRLASRDLMAAFRGSVLGWVWLLVIPFGSLTVYALSVSSLPGLKTHDGGALKFALFVFCGLIYFQMFAELMIRAPHVLAENIGLVKKVIFPIEILAWVAIARATITAVISMVILVALAVAVQGLPSPAILLLPVIFVGYCLMLLGVVWLLSIVGIVFRDLTYIMGALMPALMFLTPVFYSPSQFSDITRPIAYINPLTIFIEATRAIVIDGTAPWGLVIGAIALSLAAFHLGCAFFSANRDRIVDAL